MKSLKNSILCLLAFFVLTPAFAQEKQIPSLWTENFNAALAKGKTENKTVLLLFTGSTWCPPCKYLEKNILSSEEFKEYAKANLICVIADYGRSSGFVSKEFGKEHEALSEKYGVEGFPTVILIKPDGTTDKIVGLVYRETPAFLDWVKKFSSQEVKK